MMKKLAGGSNLRCGHQQVLSYLRRAIAASGQEQTPVWCIECNEWSSAIPQEYTEEIQVDNS